jgi:hypothetical protein
MKSPVKFISEDGVGFAVILREDGWHLYLVKPLFANRGLLIIEN